MGYKYAFQVANLNIVATLCKCTVQQPTKSLFHPVMGSITTGNMLQHLIFSFNITIHDYFYLKIRFSLHNVNFTNRCCLFSLSLSLSLLYYVLFVKQMNLHCVTEMLFKLQLIVLPAEFLRYMRNVGNTFGSIIFLLRDEKRCMVIIN